MGKPIWIWKNKKRNFDEYVDFVQPFQCGKGETVILEISVNSDYIAYVNGKIVGFGQYRDYPHYKVKDRVDISSFVRDGDNTLCIISSYIGENFFVYAGGEPGIWFSVQSQGKEVACSTTKTLSRISREYESYKKLKITCQLGYGYHYHGERDDDWKMFEGDFSKLGFEPSVETFPAYGELYPRPIEKLQLLSPIAGKLIQQGGFTYGDEERLAEKMQYAALSYQLPEKMVSPVDSGIKVQNLKENEEGIYLLYDLEKEDCGYLRLDIQAQEGTLVDVSFGEHIARGRVSAAIHDRNFVLQYTCGNHRRAFVGIFRRLGVRYLQLYIHACEAVIYEVGIQPVRYPQKKLPYQASNLLRQEIYDTATHTLELCMHEAFEDCPWREQALYNMDSRNQMLCAYYAFRNFDFSKSVLELMAQGVRSDGFLPICYPCGWDRPIPSFNLIYVKQMQEYLEYSGDKAFLREKLPFLVTLLGKFTERLQQGILPRLHKENETFWDFYEWTPTLCGEEREEDFDCALTAFYAYALRAMTDICKVLREKELEAYYKERLCITNQALADMFFDTSVGLFRTFGQETRAEYSALVNALCVLTGAANLVNGEKIEKALLGEIEKVRPCTLSMSIFRYDALLKINEKYGEFVLNDLDATYFAMLQKGATTFWETKFGEEDFGGAGSLCHGWSAIPIYYYHRLCENCD